MEANDQVALQTQQQVENTNKIKDIKNKKRQRKRRRKKKIERRVIEKKNDQIENVEIEYVSADVLNENDPNYEELKRIFSRFATAEELTRKPTKQEETTNDIDESSSETEEEPEETKPKISKKKLKKEKRLKVAQLKQLVSRPEVVEVHDVTAQDPKLLVFLKSYRNTVPVPRHWSQKRKYLQGKRGIEKPPFKLPDFIEQTGITQIREQYRAKEESKTAKQKGRARMNPKLGKLDIDYQILHDAFFKYQTKPKLTIHGDLYYEGKEFEIKLQNCKPGKLSERLKKALGMPPGAPPPWLINMQRHGPPPSYPNLKIPGLNAPIPEGAQWGYHPGGWGRPPLDEFGRPLYGDVFGKQTKKEEESDEEVEHEYWGELEDYEEEEPILQSERVEEEVPEEEEEEEEVEAKVEEKKISQEALESGITSVPATGLETPDVVELRKRKEPTKEEEKEEEEEESKPLYHVLEEKKKSVGAGIMGSQHGYVLPGQKELQPKVDEKREKEELEKRKREEEENKKRKRESSKSEKRKKFKF